MMSANNTARALFSSMLSILLCCTMLFGTTLAWFSDSSASGSNVIQSGNLKIDVQYTLDGTAWKALDGAEDLFQRGLWEPGHTELAVLRIENTGSLSLQYAANLNSVSETPGVSRDGAPIVLSELLTVSTLLHTAGEFNAAAPFAAEDAVTYARTEVFKNASALQESTRLMPGEIHYLIVKVDMADTLGSEVNHDGVSVPRITFGVSVLANQSASERDSFGDQYDKDSAAAAAGQDPDGAE